MSIALAVFAKRPIPGQVKTRLTPALSPEAAARLYWAMVEDTWARASELPGVDLSLFVDQPWEGFNALAEWVATGDIAWRIDVQEGFENIPATLQRLFSGANIGKQLLKLADPE